MTESLLCKLGLHHAVYPLKHRRVGLLTGHKMCSRCHRTQTFDGRWVFYDDWEKNFDEAHLIELERSCYANTLGKSVKDMNLWWRMMKDYDKREGITGQRYPDELTPS